MSLSRWLLLIALMMGLGCLEVAQRNAIILRGYAVGERMERLHTQETDVTWLQAQVAGLSSPLHLADVARARQLQLVAWSTLPEEPSRIGPAPSTHEEARYAAVDAPQPMARRDASD